MFSRIWFPTLIFAVATIVGFGLWGYWGEGAWASLYVIVGTPLAWAWLVARRGRFHAGWGAAVGAFMGLVVQVAPVFVPWWFYELTRPPHRVEHGGMGDLVLVAVVVVLAQASAISVPVGACLGFACARIQRRLERTRPAEPV